MITNRCPMEQLSRCHHCSRTDQDMDLHAADSAAAGSVDRSSGSRSMDGSTERQREQQ